MAQVMRMLLNNPETGKPELFELDLKSLRPGTIPKALVGPFRYTFVFDTGKGPVEFHANLMINDLEVQASFEQYPVIARVYNGYDMTGPVRKFQEFKAEGEDAVMTLDPKLFGRTHIWIHIQNGTVTAGTYDAAKKIPYTLPFYNFHNQGTVCMGNTTKDADPLKLLNNFLSSWMTPHHTYSGTHTFKPSDDMKKVALVGNFRGSDPFDWPVSKEMFEKKPIATIAPL